MAVGGFAALAIREAAKFEAQLAEVNTMLDKGSMHHLANYEKGLRRLATTYGESTQTLAKGLYDILSASVEPGKAMQVLEVSTRAAAGGLTDTGVAADAITTILNAYGMNAAEAGDISDKLFATVKRGKITFGQLASSIGKVAATGNMAGLSLEELLASVSTITRAGISADQAMTAIQGTLRSFLKPATEAKKVFKELYGREMNVATLRAEGLQKILLGLKDATAQQVAAMFPNIRGLKGVAAAMGDAAGLATDLTMQMNAGGMATDAFRKRQQTLSFQLNRVKQGFFEILRAVGKALMPEMREFSDWMLSLTRAIARNADKIAAWIKKIVMVGIKVLAVVGTIKLITAALGVLNSVMQGSPIGIILRIAAAVAISMGAWSAFDGIMGDVKKGMDGFIESSRTLTDIMEDQREAMESGQAESRGMVDELESIINSEDRSYTAHARVSEIISELSMKYPKLASILSRLTGDQEAQTNAVKDYSKALVEQQRQEAQALRKKELGQAQDQYTKVQRRRGSIDKDIEKFTAMEVKRRAARTLYAGRVAKQSTFGTNMGDAWSAVGGESETGKYRKAKKDHIYAKQRLKELHEEKKKLGRQAGESQGVFDKYNKQDAMEREAEKSRAKRKKDLATRVSKDTTREEAEAAKKLADERGKNNLKANVALVKSEWNGVEDKHKRELGLMKVRHFEEKKSAEKLNVDMGIIKKRQAVEIANLEARTAEENAKKAERLADHKQGKSRSWRQDLTSGIMKGLPEDMRRKLEADDWWGKMYDRMSEEERANPEIAAAAKEVYHSMVEGAAPGGSFQGLGAVSKQAQQQAFKQDSTMVKLYGLAKEQMELFRKWDKEKADKAVAKLGP